MPDTIHVIVRCFSHFRSVLNRAEVELELPPGATVNDAARAVLDMADGRLDELPFRVAVNKSFAETSDPLTDGDEIALIPPVQGG